METWLGDAVNFVNLSVVYFKRRISRDIYVENIDDNFIICELGGRRMVWEKQIAGAPVEAIAPSRYVGVALFPSEQHDNSLIFCNNISTNSHFTFILARFVYIRCAVQVYKLVYSVIHGISLRCIIYRKSNNVSKQ